VGDGAAVSFGCAVVVVGSGSSFVRPPVPTTTPGGTERTAPSLVFVPVVPVVEVLVAVVAPDEPASPLVTPAACGVSDPAPEVPDPEVPPGSSAHARPLFHPVTIAVPTPKATTKPPARPMYAWLGMGYV